MTQILRSCPGGVSSSDERGPQYQLLFTVWSEGILPLCINLLHAVGRPLAGEIAAFVNQFPSQLAKASTNFSYTSPLTARPGTVRPGAISLAAAQEATRLALISHITAEYRLAGASAGVDAMEIPALVAYDAHKKALAEDVEEVVERAGALGARIVALDDHEEAMLRTGALERTIRAELQSTVRCLKGGDE
jgi:nuclear pore complex protein Nup188